LCQVPWVFVEAILDDKPRARLVVYHDGTPGDPNRLSCRVDPLPSWGTYQERLVPGHEITEGVQAIGRCFVASVHGKRIGTYGTPEEAAHARSAWLLVHSEGPA